jgi:hypothetical protein
MIKMLDNASILSATRFTNEAYITCYACGSSMNSFVEIVIELAPHRPRALVLYLCAKCEKKFSVSTVRK